MKVVILTILFIVLVVETHQRTFSEINQNWNEKVLLHSEKCLLESGADRVLALRVIPNGDYNVTDHKIMCFFKCVGENLYIISQDGSVGQEDLADILYVDEPKHLAKAVKCFNSQISDLCEKAFRMSECVYKTIEQLMKDDAN